MKKTFNSALLKVKGPYSSANISGNLIFVSGMIPLDPETNELLRGTIEEETKRVLENMKTLLEEAGSSLEKVVKTNLYLADMSEFAKMNEIYKQFFTKDYPARTTIQAGRLPLDVKIEIDAIAEI